MTPHPAIDSLQQRLRGHRLPGGEYTIGREDARLVGRLLHSTIDVHPVFSCVASLRSLGISIDALCRLCEFELAAGPLLGEFGVRFRSPLQAGVCYQVTGLIESIDRTQSARLGVLDRLRFSVELTEPSGESALEANYLWLLPRGPVPA